MARHELTQEERSRGGKQAYKNNAENWVDRSRKGFERTMELHPYYARKHLKHKIQAFNQRRGGRPVYDED